MCNAPKKTKQNKTKQKSLTSCCGNDTSGPHQICGLREQHRLGAGFCISVQATVQKNNQQQQMFKDAEGASEA